jgi:hypothetical protein
MLGGAIRLLTLNVTLRRCKMKKIHVVKEGPAQVVEILTGGSETPPLSQRNPGLAQARAEAEVEVFISAIAKGIYERPATATSPETKEDAAA